MTKNEEIASTGIHREWTFREKIMNILKLMLELLLIVIWLAAFFIGYLMQNTVYVTIPMAFMLGCGMLLVKIASGSRRKARQK